MSKLARFVDRIASPKFIYKGERVYPAWPKVGPAEHRYKVFSAAGKYLTSFVCDAETAAAIAKRDKLETISAAGLWALEEKARTGFGL